MTEQTADDALKDKIIFTYRWDLTPPLPDDDDDDADGDDEHEIDRMETMITSYNVTTMEWQLHLTNDHLNILYQGSLVTNGIFNVSYKLFCDNNMEIELYARKTGAVAKIVILIALSFSTQVFFRPFDLPSHPFNKKKCAEYPENFEKDFRFEFLKDSDYLIKCSDGHSMPALKMVLNVSSKFMHTHFKESK
uniref:Uncharacterized protein n=1 Tax=Panagrolaimus sp. PS1159 TaxID=55785 RepID=A0AC35G7N4_9BILA